MLRLFNRIQQSTPESDTEKFGTDAPNDESPKRKQPWYIRIPLKFAINIVRLIIAMAMLSFLLSFLGK